MYLMGDILTTPICNTYRVLNLPRKRETSIDFPSFSIVSPWFSMEFPHDFPWNFPMIFHGFPIIFHRFPHDFPWISPWFSMEFPRILQLWIGSSAADAQAPAFCALLRAPRRRWGAEASLGGIKYWTKKHHMCSMCVYIKHVHNTHTH